jgi:hypothetical protein
MDVSIPYFFSFFLIPSLLFKPSVAKLNKKYLKVLEEIDEYVGTKTLGI